MASVTSSTLEWIDVGVNLAHKSFQRDTDAVVQYANQAHGVRRLISTVTALQNAPRTLELCKRYDLHKTDSTLPPVTCTMGIHPHSAKTFQGKDSVDAMRKLCQQEKRYIKAIGEAGLDYNRMFSTVDQQLKCFDAQVQLACELQLPLFLHEREAHDDFLCVLDPYLVQGVLQPTSVLVHCFTGAEKELHAYVKRGFYVGLTGYLAKQQRGAALRSYVHHIPLDRLVLETDAPFMQPDGAGPYLTQVHRNEPCTLPLIAQAFVDAWNGCAVDGRDPLTLAQISEMTTRNAERFFRLSAPEMST